MKRILGLDLGTNSIGWALVEIDHENGLVKIMGLGSRILPMKADEISDFENSGKIKSSAAQRTEKRGFRKVIERYKLRRDRLHLVLNLLSALPKHYKLQIDFTNNNGQKSGKFKEYKEPKIAYSKSEIDSKKKQFLFEESYVEMLNDMGLKNETGDRVPRDWTLYYLRNKALTQPISMEELSWVLLSYNQKRGYHKQEVAETGDKNNQISEELDLSVVKVVEKLNDTDNPYYEIHLDGIDKFKYHEYSNIPLTKVGDIKEVRKVTKTDERGIIEEGSETFTIIDIYPLIIEQVEYKKSDSKHEYRLRFNNGWPETKKLNNLTFKYQNTINKTFDYIVETSYDRYGNLIKIQGKERLLKEPDFSETSKDWTLVKKKTEKEALEYNEIFKEKIGKIPAWISPKIYSILKEDGQTGIRSKIIGDLFQTVDRKFYREELHQIISTQRKYHSEVLNNQELFEKCVQTLYPQDSGYKQSLIKNKNAIEHLLIEDILLYQRPLKSKKSEIANCKFEIQQWKEEIDKTTGEVKYIPYYHKVVSASHPHFQEFRIWDKLHSLRLLELEKTVESKTLTNVDVTKEFFNTADDYQALFKELDTRKSLNQHQFLTFCKKRFKINYNAKESNYAWNFPEDEELKGNETKVSFISRFKRCGFEEIDTFLTQSKEIELWHYLYSVPYLERVANEKKSIRKFFTTFLQGHNTSEEVFTRLIEDFSNYPKFPSRYCAYSDKALKKLLPLIRLGTGQFHGQFDLSDNEGHLNKINYDKQKVTEYVKSLSSLAPKTKEALSQELYASLWQHQINTRVDEILQKLQKIDFDQNDIDYSKFTEPGDLKIGRLGFPKGLFKAFAHCKSQEDFRALDLTKASYLAYGRHSELSEAKYWTSPQQIKDELHKELKQHSLNNPIAEKVLLEMMQMVAAIWKHFGQLKENSNTEYKRLFDEIHVEVGRELKKSAKEKEGDTKRQSANKTQNKRLRAVLEEFLANSTYKANPKNSDHFERLKILEDAALSQYQYKKKAEKDAIDSFLKAPITKEKFDRYKLWIQQGYRSPYTDLPIQLTDLFDGNKYNIDHVFPQASVTNDSLSNKVVCEKEINILKSKMTGRAFVMSKGNEETYCAAHKRKVQIVDDETYVRIVKAQFSGSKKMILLAKDIPKGFTSSQLNNTRHIARKAMELLSHIVREEGEIEFRSKNVLPVTGQITSKLKKAWQLDQVWTELVSPRFIRLNELTNSRLFGEEKVAKSGHSYFDCNLDDALRNQDESYDIKRIDHRHHALDALVVALCTPDHVHYINNINANVRLENYGQQKQLEHYRSTLKRKIMFSKPDKENPKENNWYFMLPGEKRIEGSDNSKRDSVHLKKYFFGDTSFGQDHQQMILSALQHTIVTFKQNLRVINKTVNRYNNTPSKKKYTLQKGTDAGNKNNWAIRRSMSEDTFYGKVNMGEMESKQLHKCISILYYNTHLVNNAELKDQILAFKIKSQSFSDFAKFIREQFSNKKVELIKEQLAVRKPITSDFNSMKIEEITDKGIQKILKNHLRQFDTVALPFDRAMERFDCLLERTELESIVANEETDFESIEELSNYLRASNFKFDKSNYSTLNVFVDQDSSFDWRNKKDENGKKFIIKEHPEIAFSPEELSKMNTPESLLKLNNGKKHTPIKKVRLARGFGKQRPLSDDTNSVKNKQYVATDAGSNLYLGFYERQYRNEDGELVKERKFEDINLIDLIDMLKANKQNRHHPLPEKILDDEQNEYRRIFTLSPLDLVYVPTEDELENINAIDFDNLTPEQISRIYKYVDGGFNKQGGLQTNFIPFQISNTIKIPDLKIGEKVFKGEITLTTDKPKQQKTLAGYHKEISEKLMIRDICIKLQVDRLGKIKNLIGDQ